MRHQTRYPFPAPVAAAAIIACALCTAPGALAADDPGRESRWYDQYLDRASIPMHGTVRDFFKKNRRELNPDFNRNGPGCPKGQYIDIMQQQLDADGKPAFSGGGFQIDTHWVDVQKRPIIWPKPFIDAWPGDQAGRSPNKEHREVRGAVKPEEDVPHWFRDDASTNETFDAPITLKRMFAPDGPPSFDPPTAPKPKKGAASATQAVYVFDSLIPKGKKQKDRPGQPKLPKSKRVDDILAMITSGEATKKRYTFEAETTFIFEPGTVNPDSANDPPAPTKRKPKGKPKPPPLAKSGYWLTVSAQDDVWVYIDGKLVIDLGAYNGKEKRAYCTQTIELDRLDSLRDGGTYSLKIFMADRDKQAEASHLKIMTNIPTLGLVGPTLPPEQFD